LILKLSLCLDEDTMSRTLVTALRARGVDLETVVEAELEGESDEVQLDRAASRGRVLYTFNVADYCRLHREYLERGAEHSGIVVVPRQRYRPKQQIRLLSKLWKTESAESMRNRLVFL
jgi:hypothetical protein